MRPLSNPGVFLKKSRAHRHSRENGNPGWVGCGLPLAREWRWKGFCKGLQEQAVNWLDVVITVAWIMGLFLGWRMGLFGAIFAAGGTVVGVFLAARFSDDIADLLTNSVSSDTLATVIAYVVILAAVFVAAQILRSTVKEGLKRVALGWVDPIGGMALGLLLGFLLAGALITLMARYSTNLPPDSGGDTAIMVAVDRSGLQEGMHNSLSDSNLVPVYLEVMESFPVNAVLVPVAEDFWFSLWLLKNDFDTWGSGDR